MKKVKLGVAGAKSKLVTGSASNWFNDMGRSHRRLITVVGIAVIGLLAILIPVAIIQSHAATNVFSFEPENGQIANPATSGVDIAAANGSYVQFRSGGGGGLTSGGNDTSCIFSTATQPLQQAFCEGFNQPTINPATNRSGDLNGQLWGVSRVNANTNFGQGQYAEWYDYEGPLCGVTGVHHPPNDLKICNGQLQDGLTSGGGVVSLAMYPKQPFDFTGRTGTVVFDVSNDSHGTHDVWPEFWISDKPVPDPFNHFDSWESWPRHGLGIRFGGGCGNGGCGGNCSSDGSYYSLNIDSAVIIRSYVGEDNVPITYDKCIKEPNTGDGRMNHFEIRISQNQMDVYGTDAFAGTWNPTATPLKHMAAIPNANLSFTKGLIWMEDVHYNPEKGDPTHMHHSFRWDNVGFDGPKTYRDLAYDVPDNSSDGNNLAYYSGYGMPVNVTVKNVNIGSATSALLTYNFSAQDSSEYPIEYTINGHPHTVANGNPLTPWPFHTNSQYATPLTIDIPISLNEIQNGDNTITFKPPANLNVVYYNINLIMVAGAPVP